MIAPSQHTSLPPIKASLVLSSDDTSGTRTTSNPKHARASPPPSKPHMKNASGPYPHAHSSPTSTNKLVRTLPHRAAPKAPNPGTPGPNPLRSSDIPHHPRRRTTCLVAKPKASARPAAPGRHRAKDLLCTVPQDPPKATHQPDFSHRNRSPVWDPDVSLMDAGVPLPVQMVHGP